MVLGRDGKPPLGKSSFLQKLQQSYIRKENYCLAPTPPVCVRLGGPLPRFKKKISRQKDPQDLEVGRRAVPLFSFGAVRQVEQIQVLVLV